MTNPLLQIPPKVRLACYYVYAVGSLVGIYLVAKHLVGAPEIALWSGLGTLFGATAATHTPKPVKGARRAEAGESALYLALTVLVILAIVWLLLNLIR